MAVASVVCDDHAAEIVGGGGDVGDLEPLADAVGDRAGVFHQLADDDGR